MKRFTKSVLFTIAYSFITICCYAQNQSLFPKPYGALPTERQLKWHEMEMYCLIHYTPTVFQNEERGYGDADPSTFNPSNFNADQIVSAAKAGGFKGIIYVTKHHDGFAMWPTKAAKYNISESSWRNGKGDVVKDFQLAAKKEGLKFGIYCSPWDRNNPNYGTPAYVTDYRNELKELYTNYGELFMSWHDGANGGDGYYGGKKESRVVDPATYYDWSNTWKLIRKLQPNAVIFSDVGPDVRWVGNENGFAPETSWATITIRKFKGKTAMPGFANTGNMGSGDRNGEKWVPFEADVPLRPNWFYHTEDDQKVKTVTELFQIYCTSVGRGGGLDLGLSPNKEGLLHSNDVAILSSFGKLLKQAFAHNMAKEATINASNVRAKQQKLFGTAHLTDVNRYSYWATDDKVHQATLNLTFKKSARFNIIQFRENIKLGQRIDSIQVETFKNKQWIKLATATSIGANRIIRLSHTEKTEKLRVRVYAPVAIALSEIGLYNAPDLEQDDIEKSGTMSGR